MACRVIPPFPAFQIPSILSHPPPWFSKQTSQSALTRRTHPLPLTQKAWLVAFIALSMTYPAVAVHAHLAHPIHLNTRLTKPRDVPQTNQKPLPSFASPSPRSQWLQMSKWMIVPALRLPISRALDLSLSVSLEHLDDLSLGRYRQTLCKLSILH